MTTVPRTIAIILFISLQFTYYLGFAQGIECTGCRGMNGHHNPGCPYQQERPNSTSSSTPATDYGQILVNEIFNSVLNNAAKNREKQAAEEAALAEKEKQERLAAQKLQEENMKALLAKKNRYNDSIAEKLQREMKPLEGKGDVVYKPLDTKPQSKLSCKIMSFKGEAYIIKGVGKPVVPLLPNHPVEFGPGDILITEKDSHIRMEYGDAAGKHSALLGQNSMMTMTVEPDGTMIPKIERGQFYSTNSKPSEVVAETTENLISNAQNLLNMPREIWSEFLKRCRKLNAVRTPAACCCVRGTEFSVLVDSSGISSVYVFDGVIDFVSERDAQLVTLTPGFFGVTNPAGEIIGVYKFDPNLVDKWWLKEE